MADERLWLLLPRPVRELPADLAAVITLVILTDLSVLVPVVRDTPLRIVLGLAFVLFLPGYAFISALFPETGPDVSSNSSDTDAEFEGGIDGLERVALAFGLSIAISPLIGLVLNFTPWGIRLVPIILSLSAFTLIAVAVAAIRRWQLPVEERFSVPYQTWFGAARSELFEPETRADTVLNVMLVLSIILATTSVVYAVAVPKPGESFSEFYLLTENETGDLVADDYPTEFQTGESKPVVVGIGNHEHRTVDYTVVVTLQNVTFKNNSTLVHRERELQRFQTRLADNRTWRTSYNVTPRMTGQRLRLAFLLYTDSVPAEPTVENAYRETHLWINVTSRDDQEQRLAPVARQPAVTLPGEPNPFQPPLSG